MEIEYDKTKQIVVSFIRNINLSLSEKSCSNKLVYYGRAQYPKEYVNDFQSLYYNVELHFDVTYNVGRFLYGYFGKDKISLNSTIILDKSNIRSYPSIYYHKYSTIKKKKYWMPSLCFPCINDVSVFRHCKFLYKEEVVSFYSIYSQKRKQENATGIMMSFNEM